MSSSLFAVCSTQRHFNCTRKILEYPPEAPHSLNTVFGHRHGMTYTSWACLLLTPGYERNAEALYLNTLTFGVSELRDLWRYLIIRTCKWNTPCQGVPVGRAQGFSRDQWHLAFPGSRLVSWIQACWAVHYHRQDKEPRQDFQDAQIYGYRYPYPICSSADVALQGRIEICSPAKRLAL